MPPQNDQTAAPTIVGMLGKTFGGAGGTRLGRAADRLIASVGAVVAVGLWSGF